MGAITENGVRISGQKGAAEKQLLKAAARALSFLQHPGALAF